MAPAGAAWVGNVGDASGNRALILRATTGAAPLLTQFFTPVSPDDTNPLFGDMVARLPAGDTVSTAPVLYFVVAAPRVKSKAAHRRSFHGHHLN